MQDNQLRQITAWRQELQRFPNKRLHHRIAEVLTAAGRPHEALEVVETGLTVHPGNLSYLDIKGVVLITLGRWPEAVEVLSDVVKRVGSFEAKLHLTQALFGVSREDEARRLGDELLKQNPFHAELRRLLAEGRHALPNPITADRPWPDEAASQTAEAEAVVPVAAAPEPEKPVEPELPRESLADVTQSEGTESAAHNAALAGLAAKEADRLVSDFFDPLLTTGEAPLVAGDNGNGAPVAAPQADDKEEIYEPPAQPAESEAAADEPAEKSEETEAPPGPEADGVDQGVEYDPTDGMDEELVINEIDVFGDLQSREPAEKKEPHQKLIPAVEPPSPEEAEPLVGFGQEERQSEANGEKNRKKFWKTWRSRKEKN